MPSERSGVPALIREARAAIELGNKGGAFLLLHRAEGMAPSPAAWREIGDAWHAAGNAAAGATAHMRAARASVRDPELAAVYEALRHDALDEAARLLDARIASQPSDIAAIRMQAELAERLGRARDAEALYLRALGLAPDYEPARHNLVECLHRQGRSVEALAQIDRLLADHPGQPAYSELRADILAAMER